MKKFLLSFASLIVLSTAVVVINSAFRTNSDCSVEHCDEKNKKCKKGKKCCKYTKAQEGKSGCSSEAVKKSCCASSKKTSCGSKTALLDKNESQATTPVKRETEKEE